MWWGVVNSTLENHKLGPIKDSKRSGHKIDTFRGGRDIFGPLNGPLL